MVSEQPALPGLRAEHAILSQKARGHYAYYGITGNFRMLKAFLRAVQRAWRWWLSRRNRRRDMNWDRFQRLLEALRPSVAADRPLIRQAAKPWPDEPYALMCACTDPWEPWAGNRPGPPGRMLFRPIQLHSRQTTARVGHRFR